MAIDAGYPELEGFIYTDGEWEPEQCQWCYERQQLLAQWNNIQMKTKGSQSFEIPY